MRILIIEDEPLVARDIQNQIMRIGPDIEVLAILSSVEGARQWFRSNPAPDLILSDIQLSDGISFEVFEGSSVDCPIIFTTAYDDYAIRAFKLNSIDYLLKPIDSNELARALQKYHSRIGKTLLGNQIKDLINEWGQVGTRYKDRFLVMLGNSMVPLRQDDIAYFHKEQLIYVHGTGNEKYLCEFNALDEVEELLDPKVFFRVNRQYIIHVQSVNKIRTSHKGLTVVLKNPGIEIDISREKAVAFKKWLG